jgi:GNAT superfamily N-acetyltransferase
VQDRSSPGSELSQPVRLKDGRVLEVRLLHPEDAPGLVHLFARLSPQAIRRRFFGSKKQLTAAEAAFFAGVDQRANVAICAVEPSSVERPIVAVGRFHATEPGRAELALVVEQSYQGSGLGRYLLTHLLSIAEENGLEALEGYVLIENKPMRHLLETAGRPLQLRQRADALAFELRLHQPAGA